MQNYLATVTLGDFIGPETLAQLGLLETEEQDTEFCSIEQAEFIMHHSMTQYGAWHRLWLFGIIVDDDMDYYVPDDYDTDVSLIDLTPATPAELVFE